MENPVARQDGLVMQEVPDELLVYDLRTDKAHCLNRSAAMVWKLCDGTNSVDDIVRQFKSAGGGTITQDFVWLALSQLDEKRLLDTTVAPRFKGESRRQLIRRMGYVSAALPLIASLVAPARFQSLSDCHCTAPAECIMSNCTSMTNCNPIGLCAPNPPIPINTSFST